MSALAVSDGSRATPDQRLDSRDAILATAVGLISAVVMLQRLLLTGPALDRLWAEDGSVFLARADDITALVETYSGYAHLVPRLVAAAGFLLPTEAWAVYATLAAVACVGGLAAFVYVAARIITGSRPASVLAASVLALTPSLRFESLGSIANLQWFLLIAALWALLLPPHRMPKCAATITFLAGGSTPLVALLIPAAVMTHGRRAGRSPAVLGAMAGLCLQLVLITLGSDGPSGVGRAPSVPPDVWRRFLDYAGGVGVEVTAFMLIGVIAAGAAAMIREPALRRVTAAFLVSALLLLIVTSLVTGAVVPRYVALATMVLLSVVAVATAATPWSWVGLAAVGVVCVVALPADPWRLSGASWSAEVGAWELRCATGSAPGALHSSPDGWSLTLACPDGLTDP